jgi:hypothetical protein
MPLGPLPPPFTVGQTPSYPCLALPCPAPRRPALPHPPCPTRPAPPALPCPALQAINEFTSSQWLRPDPQNPSQLLGIEVLEFRWVLRCGMLRRRPALRRAGPRPAPRALCCAVPAARQEPCSAHSLPSASMPEAHTRWYWPMPAGQTGQKTCTLVILFPDPPFVSFLPFSLSCRGLPTDYWWCWAAVGYVISTLLLIILPLFVAALTFLGGETPAKCRRQPGSKCSSGTAIIAGRADMQLLP